MENLNDLCETYQQDLEQPPDPNEVVEIQVPDDTSHAIDQLNIDDESQLRSDLGDTYDTKEFLREG